MGHYYNEIKYTNNATGYPDKEDMKPTKLEVVETPEYTKDRIKLMIETTQESIHNIECLMFSMTSSKVVDNALKTKKQMEIQIIRYQKLLDIL